MTPRGSPPGSPLAAALLADAAAPEGGIGRGVRGWMDYVGLLPFAVFVALFLLWPTVLVVFGAFQDPEGGPTLANLVQASQGTYLQTFVTSTVLSAVTAVLGAVFGGLLAWAISVGRARSPAAPARARRLGHACPVRRRDARLRVSRHLRLQRPGHAVPA